MGYIRTKDQVTIIPIQYHSPLPRHISPQMIVKNLKIRKKRYSTMGQIISKEKKQKREALLPQMKSKAEAAPVSPAKKPPSPSSSSPPPPPRSLAATLASAALSAEFLAYLQKLDTAAGGGADREDTLQFVIKVRSILKFLCNKSQIIMASTNGF